MITLPENDPVNQAFAKGMKVIRLELGLSLRSMAERMQMSHEHVWVWENARQSPTLKTIVPRLARLGLTVEDVLEKGGYNVRTS